ncbi:hypothetical protein ASPBRDRAFT_52175 [Aspergillus brasiliensis CBS 101740]|uniref:Uncharacterized protein n=1 Tax=Aspergillus brasiliensis (strain CBS 101740 / IMI 381727 / IBT 21946) TaxID=767769 RepID=A0A1L9UY63_ASPBC|nr:hypothetical protein ASPBRDRAFT_52175 [Aspergillus brasiliensis CBS 101740]
MAHDTGYPQLLVTLFHELLNTFIHSAGDYPLLSQVHQIWHKEPDRTNNLLVLVPIGFGLIASFLIRYVIGHVLMSMLIVEISVKQTGSETSDSGQSKPAPPSRYLLQAIGGLYSKGGVKLFLNGIGSACTYWMMHSSTTGLLHKLVSIPGPIADILATVLLAEYRFFWTARTILPRHQQHFVLSSRDYQRLKALVPATAVYAIIESFMMDFPALFHRDFALSASTEVTKASLLGIVRSDILVSGVMLAAQLLLFFPALIALTLVQVSLLPSTCETLISAPANQRRQQQQQRGSRIGEIFAVFNRVPLKVQDAAKIIEAKHVLWCLELHGKMCVCLFGVSAVVHLAVYNMK